MLVPQVEETFLRVWFPTAEFDSENDSDADLKLTDCIECDFRNLSCFGFFSAQSQK